MHADLHARIPPILLQDRAERPALQLAPAADDRACPVSPHVAAHERGEARRLQEERECVDDQGLRRRGQRREVVCDVSSVPHIW